VQLSLFMRTAEALQQVNIKFSTGDEEIKIMECIGHRRVHTTKEGAPDQMIIYGKGRRAHTKKNGQATKNAPR
jgi:hypothetical protein